MNQAIWLVFIQTAMVTERPSGLVQWGLRLLFLEDSRCHLEDIVASQPDLRLFGFYRRNKNLKSLLTIAHHEAPPASISSEYQRQISIWVPTSDVHHPVIEIVAVLRIC